MRFSEVFVADLCQKNILLGCRPPDEADAGLSGAAKRGPGSDFSARRSPRSSTLISPVYPQPWDPDFDCLRSPNQEHLAKSATWPPFDFLSCGLGDVLPRRVGAGRGGAERGFGDMKFYEVFIPPPARLSAGWRSSAFSKGPSAHQPIERARPAKSGAGPNRSMPI